MGKMQSKGNMILSIFTDKAFLALITLFATRHIRYLSVFALWFCQHNIATGTCMY